MLYVEKWPIPLYLSRSVRSMVHRGSGRSWVPISMVHTWFNLWYIHGSILSADCHASSLTLLDSLISSPRPGAWFADCHASSLTVLDSLIPSPRPGAMPSCETVVLLSLPALPTESRSWRMPSANEYDKKTKHRRRNLKAFEERAQKHVWYVISSQSNVCRAFLG